MDLSSILVLIIFCIILVILVIVFNSVAKKVNQPKKVEKPEPKVEETEKEEPKTEEIPEILQDVTRRNYMRERAQQQADNHEFTLDDVKETNEALTKKQYHRIQPLDEEDESMDTQDILSSMDGENSGEGQTVVDEFRNLSPRMKTIIVADALKKKDDE